MKFSLGHLPGELRADILSAKTVPALSAGLTSGLGLLVAQVAFGSFIFSGGLAAYASQGVGLILFGNFAACLLVALSGGYRGAIAGLSPALVISMATIAATIDAQGEALFVTAASALVISAIATGLCCLLIGRFHLANLVRFIPYPVAAGFVAGIGGAVCLAALSLMGANPGWQTAATLLEPAVLWTWLPGAAYGIALYAAMKRWGNALFLPLSVVAAIGAYHLVLGVLDISGDEARAMGLLLTSTADGGLWPTLFPADLVHVQWAALAGQIPNMLTLMLIAFICVILNVAGLELAVNQELDWNREFKASGFASLVAGLGGGTVATLIVPASLRSKLFRATTRLTGVVAAIVIGAAVLLGDGMLEFVPTMLIGGILVFTGLGMLDEGLVRSRKRLAWVEFGIILVIFVVIIFVGLGRGRGHRVGGHSRVLRRAPQPRRSDRVPVYRARAPQQPGSTHTRSRDTAGGRRARAGLPVAWLHLLRQRRSSDRSAQTDPGGPIATDLPDAGFCRRLRPGFFGGKRAVPIPAHGE